MAWVIAADKGETTQVWDTDQVQRVNLVTEDHPGQQEVEGGLGQQMRLTEEEVGEP